MTAAHKSYIAYRSAYATWLLTELFRFTICKQFLPCKMVKRNNSGPGFRATAHRLFVPWCDAFFLRWDSATCSQRKGEIWCTIGNSDRWFRTKAEQQSMEGVQVPAVGQRRTTLADAVSHMTNGPSWHGSHVTVQTALPSLDVTWINVCDPQIHICKHAVINQKQKPNIWDFPVEIEAKGFGISTGVWRKRRWRWRSKQTSPQGSFPAVPPRTGGGRIRFRRRCTLSAF